MSACKIRFSCTETYFTISQINTIRSVTERRYHYGEVDTEIIYATEHANKSHETPQIFTEWLNFLQCLNFSKYHNSLDK
nr:hypothetical transcript [Hymenolepis microstoma]